MYRHTQCYFGRIGADECCPCFLRRVSLFMQTIRSFALRLRQRFGLGLILSRVPWLRVVSSDLGLIGLLRSLMRHRISYSPRCKTQNYHLAGL